MKVGFIGLGNIGKPMAEQLTAPPFELTVYDALPAALTPFEGKARLARSAADLARTASLIGICVRHDADVAALFDGSDGLLAGAAAGTVVAIHSTVRPVTVRAAAHKAAAQGVAVVDAAVTGGPAGATAKRLTCMAGGDAAALAAIRPLLDAFCSEVIHAGPAGAGMALKLANNLVTYFHLMSAHEGYKLAVEAGVDAGLLSQVMNSNDNLTTTMRLFMEFRANGVGLLGQAGFDAFQKATANLAEKDIDLALELARDVGASLPGAQALRGLIANVVLNR
jgi:3-hydroxyisobutyrate dehydrogenase